MKIKKDYIRNPIIARLLIAQIFLIGLGLLAVFLACIAIDRFNNDRQMERLKKDLSISILSNEDQLLAWSQLGMISAQKDLLEKLKSQLHLLDLKIVSEADFQFVVPSPYTFTLDSKLAKDLGKYVLVEVDPQQLHFSSISPSVGLLIALGFLALLTIFYSAYFILQHVFKPIHHIRWNLERLESAEEITFDSTKTIGEIKDLINVVQRLYLKSMTKENERIRSQIAASLAHDIRSPLAALKVVKDMGTKEMDPDIKKLLTMSIDRITDIANTILPKNTNQVESKDNVQSSFLWMLIDQIISEKRVEYKSSNDISIDFQIESSPFELNAFCNPTEFMRSISNIINNSIEAKDPDRKLVITVKLSSAADHIILTIEDNGKGIASDALPKVFDEGFSHQKTHGTGLGLYQVKKAVESWNGAIQITSVPDRETFITIQLKKTPQPSWLATSIQISSYKNMVVLDDEEYVFSILQDRFEKHFKEIQYFKRIDEFEENIMSFSESFIFVDHDLKQNMTGIDLIEKYNLQKQSILLTGNYDDKQVQQRAAELGVKILPKPLINDLPIVS